MICFEMRTTQYTCLCQSLYDSVDPVTALRLDLCEDTADAFSAYWEAPTLHGALVSHVYQDIILGQDTETREDTVEELLFRFRTAPREDEEAKLADYRAVIGAGDLRLDEVWYLDPTAKELRVYDALTGRRRADSALLDVDELSRSLFG